jgi:hypothetical protein
MTSFWLVCILAKESSACAMSVIGSSVAVKSGVNNFIPSPPYHAP